MKKETIEKWIENAPAHESVIYYTGHLIEARNDRTLTKKTDLFMLAAEEGKIELYQKKIKAGTEKNSPIYDYIARKVKTNEKSNHNK